MKQAFHFRATALLLGLLCSMSLLAQRQDIVINNNWSFRFSHSVQAGVQQRVDLPHTWNAQDALSGKHDYKRGIGNYTKRLFVAEELRGKRLFLRFEGANSVSYCLVNHRFVGEHRGGYGAFTYEITDYVDYGKENLIEMRVSNAETLDVAPLVGDFNMYGGLYRDVHLIITDEVCIAPVRPGCHGYSGLHLKQEEVNEKKAVVGVSVDLAGGSAPRNATLTVSIKQEGRVVSQQKRAVELFARAFKTEQFSFELKKPRLWNGRQDPFLYQVEATLQTDDQQCSDAVSQNLGLRYFRFDADKGFFLNGHHLPLHGVCRHQERAEIGNALRKEHHEEDLQLMLEMGVNAVRLSHYPHAEYFYDLLDRYGIVAWSEIPVVGPGGYADTGFIDNAAFRDNALFQLEEMILQHGNHASVVCWGMFNELQPADHPEDFVRTLNDYAHKLDPTRPTTAASNVEGDLNYITDLMAWNKYDGWYGATPATLATWLDRTHSQHPEMCIAISEYGAGASIYHQQDSIVQTVPGSWWHPENWQLEYHIRNWEIISARPFVWGSFVWNMFDFGAAHRTEGDRPGINDKGLVTHDRKVRKDAFYFYKANWNTAEPTLRLADRRCQKRTRERQQFRAFCSLPEAELFVNGQSQGRVSTDAMHLATWNDVLLQPGENTIRVVGSHQGQTLADEYTVTL